VAASAALVGGCAVETTAPTSGGGIAPASDSDNTDLGEAFYLMISHWYHFRGPLFTE